MSSVPQEQDLSKPVIKLSENMTFKQLTDSLASLEVRVSDMEETLDSYLESM